MPHALRIGKGVEALLRLLRGQRSDARQDRENGHSLIYTTGHSFAGFEAALRALEAEPTASRAPRA